MSRQVFISYRRADSEGYAGRLFDHLSTRLGQRNIFMDVAAIEAGVDFAQAIEEAVRACDVLLALIGPQWLTVRDAQGKPRLEDPGDYVRLEIATALGRNIRVIPVLIQGAAMPGAAALPEDLKPLAMRNALELSSTRFHTDADRLIAAIERAMDEAEREKRIPEPVAPSARQSLHQLPQPPADFTGREELIDLLIADFEKGKGAAITSQPIHGLTGMGGIGKTSLGLVVAHQVMKDYPDAQIFLDLKGTTAPLSPVEIARHVILSLEPATDVRALDEGNISGAYQSVLHGRKVLLFFDNARSAGQVAPLRPPGLQTRRLDVMSAENARAFLLELCPRIDTKAADLAEACARLPLALRIAGSFLQVNQDWSVDKYLARLNDRKSRLSAFKESREQAELTTEPDLLAAFELSYHGLSKENREHWRKLGVFPASFTSHAAGALWGLEEEETGKLLSLFLRYSLLDYEESSARYNLHDLLADYALSQMAAGEEQGARLQHASYYKDILSAADDLYAEGGEKLLTGLRLFDLEWEHIRAGQAWAAAGKGKDPALAKLCVAYPFAGVYILNLRQHPRERIQWLETGLSSARELGDRRGEGAALGNLGNAYAALGEVHKAIECTEQHLAIARETGDRSGEGAALGNLGNAYADLGEAHKAIEYHEQALVIDREIGDRYGEGNALGNLGIA
jgi:tetratricopeptide (TPR) repeat protein